MALKLNDLPTHEQMVKNVLYTYLSASPEDTAEGMSWYMDAYAECGNIAMKYELEIPTVVALVSVISPSIMWGGNIAAPEKIIDLWQQGIPWKEWEGFNIYPANLMKAEAILNGDTSVIKGLKVISFMYNILGDSSYVTLDRWGLRVALNDPHLGTDKIIPSGIAVYAAIAEAYRDAAKLVRIAAPDIQAVTWTVYRNKYNGKVRKEKERLSNREAVRV